MGQQWGNIPAHWAVYFSVADCAAIADKAQELGGNVLQPPFNVDWVGVISVLRLKAGKSEQDY